MRASLSVLHRALRPDAGRPPPGADLRGLEPLGARLPDQPRGGASGPGAGRAHGSGPGLPIGAREERFAPDRGPAGWAEVTTLARDLGIDGSVRALRQGRMIFTALHREDLGTERARETQRLRAARGLSRGSRTVR